MTRALPKPMLEQKSFDGIPVLTDEALFRACGVRIAFTGRAGGVSLGGYGTLNTASHVGDDPDAVAENRRRVMTALGASAQANICPSQVHGTEVVVVREADGLDEAQTQAAGGVDAVAVGIPGVAALMNFADCMPIIVVSPSGRFVVAHAGWRGAVAGIVRIAVRTLESLDAEFPVAEIPDAKTPDAEVPDAMASVAKVPNTEAPDARAPGARTPDAEVSCPYSAVDYNVYLGPHIRSECFEVGEEVAMQFVEAFGASVVTRERHVDLARAVICDLERAGVDAERIADAQICTKCNPDQYFSYRATGGRCGRHAAIAVRC